MKKDFFTKDIESNTVLIIWLSLPILFFFFIENPYLLRYSEHLETGKLHLVKGAYKDIPTQKNKININKVNERELIQLNGLGPKLSERIVEYREKNGPFNSINQLLLVKGIGKKKLFKIKEFIEV